MIGKSILLTLVLLILYICLFAIFPVRTVQDLFHGNIAKGQSYVFEKEHTNRLVLIGSSLSGCIDTDSIPGLESLALGGLSIFDGLTLINSKEQLPETLLVEINVLEKSENLNYTDYFSNPILWGIYSKIPALRADARPIGYAIKMISYPFNYFRRNYYVNTNEVNLIESNQAVDNFEKLLHNQVNEYSDLSDSLIIVKNIRILSDKLYSLVETGVKVIFFEMPVDLSLRNLPRSEFIRNLYKQNFFDKGYKFIDSPNEQYSTTDGIHLTKESAIRYSIYFRSKLNE
jgi:hypothetical protein